MEDKRIYAIAAMIFIAVLLLLTADLSATAFGLVMLGGALVVAAAMYVITRRKRRR